MPNYTSIAEAFGHISSEYSGWEHREQRAREMATIINQFGSDAVADYLLEASGQCPVCGTETEGKHIRNFSEPQTGTAPVPHVLCPNACLSPLDNMADNKWHPLAGEWRVTDLEQHAVQMVSGYVQDYVADLKNVYTSGEQAELALSQAEQAAIHERLDEIRAIVEGELDVSTLDDED